MGDGHHRRFFRDAWRFRSLFWTTDHYVSSRVKVTKEVFISCAAMLYLIGIVPVFSTLAYKGVLSEKKISALRYWGCSHSRCCILRDVTSLKNISEIIPQRVAFHLNRNGDQYVAVRPILSPDVVE